DSVTATMKDKRRLKARGRYAVWASTECFDYRSAVPMLDAKSIELIVFHTGFPLLSSASDAMLSDFATKLRTAPYFEGRDWRHPVRPLRASGVLTLLIAQAPQPPARRCFRKSDLVRATSASYACTAAQN
ncbi:MAG TPA: hypothetical protein VM555_11095, partial [Tahibacter sp.]|nr:hypothetical protein [Tahibacter sp.]